MRGGRFGVPVGRGVADGGPVDLTDAAIAELADALERRPVELAASRSTRASPSGSPPSGGSSPRASGDIGQDGGRGADRWRG